MKKKMTAICAAAVLAAAMTACGSNASSETTTAAATEASSAESAEETKAESSEAEAAESEAAESESEAAESGAETGASEEVTAPAEDVAMQYITPDDAQADIGNEEYVYLDLRKAEDYQKGHIEGAVNADMDAAKDGDFGSGVENMEKALNGTEDKNLVLICYSGKRYAQAGTNVLSALGYDMSKVYTLEGGMKAWKGETVTE